MSINSTKQYKVAISGMGLVSSLGKGIESLDYLFRDNVTRPVTVPSWLFETQLEHPVFIYNNPDEDLYTDPLLPNRTLKLLFWAVKEALSHARVSFDELKDNRVGIAIGTTVGVTFNNEKTYYEWLDTGHIDRHAVESFFSSNPALVLKELLNVKGPAAVVTNACSSGTDAIGLGMLWIDNNMCDIAICGGADELSRIAFNGFVALQLASRKRARPFDVNRDGLNIGEGAGIVILENMTCAKQRGFKPYGAVLGYGAASDAWHPTAPHPEGKGLVRAMKAAIKMADVSPAQIALINAHGTGTKANDSSESCAIKALFGPDTPPVYSIKGAVGHCLGAAGAIEVVALLTALKRGEVYGTVGCSVPDNKHKVYVITEGEKIALDGKTGLKLSLAFGGTNSALVVMSI